MTITKIPANGAILITETVNGYLCQRTFYGYTRAEAIEKFCELLGLDPDEIESED